jgi:hypothetical protein
MKLHFDFEGAVAEIGDWGQYDAPIESNLPHRFELRDGVVIDKYDGVTDERVKEIDHEAATAAALNHTDAEGNPAPLDPPPLLGAITPAEEV